MPNSFVLYQEQAMLTLNYAGIPMSECYAVIKAIAKKHPEKVKPLKDRFIEGFKNKIMQDDHIEEEKAASEPETDSENEPSDSTSVSKSENQE